jgi:hypothetical protein
VEVPRVSASRRGAPGRTGASERGRPGKSGGAQGPRSPRCRPRPTRQGRSQGRRQSRLRFPRRRSGGRTSRCKRLRAQREWPLRPWQTLRGTARRPWTRLGIGCRQGVPFLHRCEREPYPRRAGGQADAACRRSVPAWRRWWPKSRERHEWHPMAIRIRRASAPAHRPSKPWKSPGSGVGGLTGWEHTLAQSAATVSNPPGWGRRSSSTRPAHGGCDPAQAGGQHPCRGRTGAAWAGRPGHRRGASRGPSGRPSASMTGATTGCGALCLSLHGHVLPMPGGCPGVRSAKRRHGLQHSGPAARSGTWGCLPQRRRAFPVRRRTDVAILPSRHGLALGRPCVPAGPRTAPVNAASPCRQEAATKRPRPGARLSMGGACICSRSHRWRPWLGCASQSDAAGATPMGALTSRPGLRPCGPWPRPWGTGDDGKISGVIAIDDGQTRGEDAGHVARPSCWRTGTGGVTLRLGDGSRMR